MSKSHHELSVFLEFAKVAGTPIDTSTVETCKPPKPDIRCICAGEPVYFELSCILGNDFMRRYRNKVLKNARENRPPPQLSSADASRVNLPERDTLQEKLSKTYQTGGVPLELLLYYDAEHLMVLGSIPPIDFEWLASEVMVPLLTPMPSHIRRVWVFERYRNSVMWCHPRP